MIQISGTPAIHLLTGARLRRCQPLDAYPERFWCCLILGLAAANYLCPGTRLFLLRSVALRREDATLQRIVSGTNRGAANVQEQLTLSWKLRPISISMRVQKRVYSPFSPCSVPGSRLRSDHSPRKRFMVTPAHRQRLPTMLRMPAQHLSQP